MRLRTTIATWMCAAACLVPTLVACAAGPVLSVEVTNGVPAGTVYADAPLDVPAEGLRVRFVREKPREQHVVGVAVEIGGGDKSTDLARGAAIWHWDSVLFSRGAWELSGYWELSLGRWESETSNPALSRINDIGLTPMFVWRRSTPVYGIVPFLEAGVGAHHIDQTELADRNFSTEFQFGDTVGVGVLFCMESVDIEVGYRLQHLSNARIEVPNDGMDFNIFRAAVHF